MSLPKAPRFFLPSLLLLALSACGIDDTVEVPKHEDDPLGCGEEPPGTPDASWSFTREIEGARRGPVRIEAKLRDPNASVVDVRLERLDGCEWRPARIFSRERLGEDVLFFWDSIADFPTTDGSVELRLVAVDPVDGRAVRRFQMELNNAPDVDRLLLVSQGMKALPGGGISQQGTGLSVVTWSARDALPVGVVHRISLAPGAGRISPAPHGRVAAVLAEGDYTISILSTPLEADAAEVKETHSLSLPQGVPWDLGWSPDGRWLWVVAGISGGSMPSLWRFEPSEDMSAWSQAQKVADLPGPPGRMAVDPVTGRVLVACGSGGQGQAKVVLYEPSGEPVGQRYEADLSPANTLAISPTGDFALLTGSFFGAEVRLLRLSDAGVEPVGEPLTSLDSPYEAVFHPESNVAVLSQLESNRLRALSLSSEGIGVGDELTGLALPAELALIPRGRLAGMGFVPVLSSTTEESMVRVFFLRSNGALELRQTQISLGMGSEAIPTGVGVQR